VEILIVAITGSIRTKKINNNHGQIQIQIGIAKKIHVMTIEKPRALIIVIGMTRLIIGMIGEVD
jgi:hypothetical protein